MDQTSCKSLQSCFSFLICEAYGIIECSDDGLYLHQKKTLTLSISNFFSAQMQYWKSRIINWNLFLIGVSSARMKLQYAVTGMPELMELGAKKVFLSCPCVIFSVNFIQYHRSESGLLSLHKDCGKWPFPSKRRERICQFMHVQFICSKLQNSGAHKTCVPDTTKFPTTLRFGRQLRTAETAGIKAAVLWFPGIKLSEVLI